MKVKICGITNLDDAKFALDNGADLLGFIFYPKSPRYVTPHSAKQIIAALPNGTETVGVFVNESNGSMLDIKSETGVRILQLHGQEPPDQVAKLNGEKIFKALPLQADSDLKMVRDFPGATILIDTPSAKHGGTGIVGNWELAKRAANMVDAILAGGLNPDNVSEAIRQVRPAGVDVSSGVEQEKGKKDPEKVRRFIEAARKAVNDLG